MVYDLESQYQILRFTGNSKMFVNGVEHTNVHILPLSYGDDDSVYFELISGESNNRARIYRSTSTYIDIQEQYWTLHITSRGTTDLINELYSEKTEPFTIKGCLYFDDEYNLYIKIYSRFNDGDTVKTIKLNEGVKQICEWHGVELPPIPTPTKSGTDIPKLDLATTGVI